MMGEAAPQTSIPPSQGAGTAIFVIIPANLAKRVARAAPAPSQPVDRPIQLISETELATPALETRLAHDGDIHLVVTPPELFDGASILLRERAWLAFYARAVKMLSSRVASLYFTDDRDAIDRLAKILNLPRHVLVTQEIAPSRTVAVRLLNALRQSGGGQGTVAHQAVNLADEILEISELLNDNTASMDPRGNSPDTDRDDPRDAHLHALATLQQRPLDCDHVIFPYLRAGPPVSDRPHKRVCIYLPLSESPPGHLGDTGLNLLSLARQFVRDGHAVTVAYDGRDADASGAGKIWRRRLQGVVPDGVELLEIPAPEIANTKGLLGNALARPYAVLEWLKTRTFDVVHLPDSGHPAFFSLLAKRQGLAFADTHFCIHVDQPVLWHKLINADPIDGPRWLARIHAERRCVEYADTLVAPTQYILGWLLRQGYAIPDDRAFVQPLLAKDPSGRTKPSRPIQEFVFLCDIEPGNGLPQFVDAVARAVKAGSPAPHVTFAGAANPAFPAETFVASKFELTGVIWTFRTDLDADKAVNYVAEGGRLAVFPSVENSGSRALQSCLEHGLPVLTSRCTGLSEMIHPDDRAHATVELHPDRMAERFRDALIDGLPATRPMIESSALAQTWRSWHAASLCPSEDGSDSAAAATSVSPTPPHDRPLVTVCIMHFNRPELVEQAIESVERQSYTNVEVVLVDDGSSHPDVPAFLDRLEPTFAERGWQIVRQPNLYLGAARNTAARHARGTYLYFLDDDNVLKPDGLETFVTVACRTKADILTSFSDAFSGVEPPDLTPPRRPMRIVQLGDDICFGLFRNGFGDSNALIRRDVFNTLGGNTEDYGVGKDDQEFFARAILSGYRLEHVPQALYWARQPPVRLRHLHYSSYTGNLRVARAYRNMLPPALQNLVLMAQGQQLRMDTFGPFADPDMTTRIVDKLTSSLSWRLTAPLHRRFNDVADHAGESRFIGLNEAYARDSGRPPPWMIYRVLNSLSWDLTAPLRVPGHIWNLGKRFLQRKLGRP